MKLSRELLVRILFLLIVYLAVEGISLAGLTVLRRTRGITYFPAASKLEPQGLSELDKYLAGGDVPMVDLDSALGWVRREGVNSQGLRDDLLYERQPRPGVLRIAAFGESFTYGSDVPLGENWTKRISAMAPAIEILNFGVGAYGLDQAYMRYTRRGAEYSPHMVFIGYMSENLARNVNVFRGFYGNGYRAFFFSKPRFKLRNDSLQLFPNPLRTIDDYRRLRAAQESVLTELGRDDYHFVGQYRAGPLDFSPSVRLGKLVAAHVRKAPQVRVFTPDGKYEPRSEAYQLTLRIFDEFYQDVLESGALPVIIVLPDANDQQRSREGKPRRYDILLEHFRSKGYRYIDVLSAFEPVQSRYTMKDLSGRWGHFSSLGNDLVARHVLSELVKWDLDDVAGVMSAATQERQRILPRSPRE